MNPDEKRRNYVGPTFREQRQAQAKQRVQWLASLRKGQPGKRSR